jgi:hypothetical protein
MEDAIATQKKLLLRLAFFTRVCYIYLHNSLQTLAKILGTTMNNESNGKFGFTTFAENWNGRLAMIGFSAALILELTTGQGVLHFFGVL